MNDTTLRKSIQDWGSSEEGRKTIDESAARRRQDIARNGNGELSRAKDLPEFDGAWEAVTLAELKLRPQIDKPWLVNDDYCLMMVSHCWRELQKREKALHPDAWLHRWAERNRPGFGNAVNERYGPCI